jgi:2-methylisocitrate lyase-like PEP mutase family enzyme
VPVDLAPRRAAFRTLHESGCFVIPNPWDPGTARALASLGFAALATTSAGFAHSRALPDGRLTLEPVLAHVAEIAAATELPVNADFQAGYADDADGVAANVARCIEAGVAGLSIEDKSFAVDGPPLYELSEGVERVRAAREAIDASGAEVMLTARAECFVVGHSDPLEEATLRLAAYAEAGADVLYAPGPHEREPIAAIVEAIAPKPVNVLIAADVGLRVADLAELGVRRISLGSALSGAAWGTFMAAAEELSANGSFAGLSSGPKPPNLNALFESS